MTSPLPQAFALLVLSCSLVATAVAQRKALDRLSQDAEAVTLALPGDADPFEAIELPGKGRVRAVACGKSDVWLVRDEIVVMTVGDLLVATPGERKVRRRLPVPEGLLGLTADDRFFYVLMKQAIVVMDANTDRVVQRIELPNNSNQDPEAIGAHGEELFISWRDDFVAVHKRTAKLRECNRLTLSPRWLAGDGRSLWGGGQRGFARVDTSLQGKRRMRLRLPELFEGGFATFVGKRLLLVQGRSAVGKRVAAAFVDTERALPHEHLSISLHRGKYQVGPKPLATLKGLAKELQRIRRDPSCMVPGPDGMPVPIPVMLIAYPGVKVREIAAAWDLVTAVGFNDLNCMSHKANSRLAERPPPPPPPPARKKL